jgi:hypothetical protein
MDQHRPESGKLNSIPRSTAPGRIFDVLKRCDITGLDENR